MESMVFHDKMLIRPSVIKGCVCYICVSLFFILNKSTWQTRKKVFYFTLNALFILEKMKF